MIRSIVIFSAITFLVSSATAFPLVTNPAAPINEEMLKVRMTKSNACKLNISTEKLHRTFEKKPTVSDAT